jgi:hypothetical protein
MALSNDGKREFVRDLIGSVQASILAEVDNMPEDWDGHELRQYIADWFEDQTTKMTPARHKAYRNEVLVRNL